MELLKQVWVQGIIAVKYFNHICICKGEGGWSYILRDGVNCHSMISLTGIVSKLVIKFWTCQKCGKMKYNKKITNTNSAE
jgi:hypothetical protein